MIDNPKNELRKKLSEIRQNIAGRITKEKIILDKLLAITRGVNCVFTYVSFGSEVSTHEFIRRFSGEIAVPYTAGTQMNPLKLISYKTLDADKKGNLLAAELGGVLDSDAAIVPMLGFNPDCFRLGYGGGFYDRFLRGYKGKKIGVAFDEQLCKSLPIEDFDVPLDIIVTPLDIIITPQTKTSDYGD